MTPEELTRARAMLGELWALGRPLTMAELGRALRMPEADPGQSIRDYETGVTKVPGAVSVAVEMMMFGSLPPDGLAVLATPRRRQKKAA